MSKSATRLRRNDTGRDQLPLFDTTTDARRAYPRPANLTRNRENPSRRLEHGRPSPFRQLEFFRPQGPRTDSEAVNRSTRIAVPNAPHHPARSMPQGAEPSRIGSSHITTRPRGGHRALVTPEHGQLSRAEVGMDLGIDDWLHMANATPPVGYAQPGLDLGVTQGRSHGFWRVVEKVQTVGERVVAAVSRRLDRSRLLRESVFVLGVLALIALAWFGS